MDNNFEFTRHVSIYHRSSSVATVHYGVNLNLSQCYIQCDLAVYKTGTGTLGRVYGDLGLENPRGGTRGHIGRGRGHVKYREDNV